MSVFVKEDMSAGMKRMGGPAFIKGVNEGGEGEEATYIVKYPMARGVLKFVRKCEMVPQEEQATRPKRQLQSAANNSTPVHERNARPRAGWYLRR